MNTKTNTLRSCLLVWVAAAAAQPALAQLTTAQNHGISPALAHNEQGHAVPTGISRLFGPVQPPPRTLFDGGNTPPAAELWFAAADPLGPSATPLAAIPAPTAPDLRVVPTIELRSSPAGTSSMLVPSRNAPGTHSVPTPGPAALFMVAAALTVRRRRR